VRSPSARLFPNTVLLQTVTSGRDAPGGSTRTYSTGTTFAASVQPASVARRVTQGGLYADASHVVLFRAYPIDTSTGARVATATQRLGPEVAVNDRITWQAVPGDTSATRTLLALGPALDQAGRGVEWAVYCSELK
jgi:hypothetical protein